MRDSIKNSTKYRQNYFVGSKTNQRNICKAHGYTYQRFVVSLTRSMVWGNTGQELTNNNSQKDNILKIQLPSNWYSFHINVITEIYADRTHLTANVDWSLCAANILMVFGTPTVDIVIIRCPILTSFTRNKNLTPKERLLNQAQKHTRIQPYELYYDCMTDDLMFFQSEFTYHWKLHNKSIDTTIKNSWCNDGCSTTNSFHKCREKKLLLQSIIINHMKSIW